MIWRTRQNTNEQAIHRRRYFLPLPFNPAMADGSVSSLGMGMGARNYEIFQRFQAVVAQYNASGERFRIDSHCQSACTMFLSIRNVCVTPNAKLLFHAGGNMREGRINPARSQEMLSTYNSKLRQYRERERLHEYVRVPHDFRPRHHFEVRLSGRVRPKARPAWRVQSLRQRQRAAIAARIMRA